jgi:hypothetical protein
MTPDSPHTRKRPLHAKIIAARPEWTGFAPGPPICSCRREGAIKIGLASYRVLEDG